MSEIRLWWIGERPPAAGMLEHVQLHVVREFELPVKLHDAPARPLASFDPRRKQHASGKILEFLGKDGPQDGKVLGITDVDLFIPILTFVFGEAQLGGRAAVVSTARLAQDLPRGYGALVTERLAKEAVHELGHALGLLHCSTPRCAMHRSPSVREVDGKSGKLCGDCRGRLRERRGGECR